MLEANIVRLRAIAMGRAHGFETAVAERLGDVAEEMAANMVRHAGKGQVIFRTLGDPESGCIEVLALDKGPGIGNMNRAMRDTPSEGVPSANGLFVVKQLANLFDIFSHPSHGTAVVAHVSGSGASTNTACSCNDASAGAQIGAICLPVHGEDQCGDAWAMETMPGRMVVFLVDGLGHGPEAAAAATAATAVFTATSAASPESLMPVVHAALRNTRGAAVSIADVDWTGKSVRFWGVGNAEVRIVSLDSNRHVIPQNGIVGHNMPRVQATDVPWIPGGRFVIHSDGITARWRVDRYPGLLARHPALLAGVLFRDFSRPRDDATIIVIREPPLAPVAT